MGGRIQHIAIAGAGIAGLTAAIALARHGFRVTVLERSTRLEEVGAGLQLSPNATRILKSLDVLGTLLPTTVRPEAIVLRQAATLRQLSAVPLGDAASRRWGAPYLTAHRADLQGALLARLATHDAIELVTGATVRDAAFHPHGVTLSVDRDGKVDEIACDLVIGADGVWSTLRGLGGEGRASRFTGHIAWRAMVRDLPEESRDAVSDRAVTAFLNPGFHVVAYPVRAGEAINLVAVTPAKAVAERWSIEGDRGELERLTAKAAHGVHALLDAAGPWTVWPLHEVDPSGAWTSPAGIALIGDAAHAMTPYAAQGAAMAIEDAAVLTGALARSPDDLASALTLYEGLRRKRIARVAARGRFNRFTWHAGGPVGIARDMVLKLQSPARLAASFDWLYGYDVDEELTRKR